MRRTCRVPVAVALVLAVLLPSTTAPAIGQGRDSVSVVAGARYAKGWLGRLLFGNDYRDLWTAPIRVAVLDLQRYAGGLTPVRTGGFGQTISLHFNGADRRRYVFRSVDKDLSRRIADELRGTFVEEVLQDQTSAFNPAAALVVAPLARAVGVLAVEPALYVMPDDVALGEFRRDYAGMLGLMMENPDEGPGDTPGFAGSRRVSDSDEVLDATEDSPRARVDAVGFLKARLLDIFIGDRDRHKGQWRWARFREGDRYVWRTVPEDRDQAFVSQDGLMMWFTRTFFVRKFSVFSGEYGNIPGLTWNGWDLDRRFLAELERPVWDSVVADVQRRLTDTVIVQAVRRLPEPYHAIEGERLERALMKRRDALPQAADTFYRLLASYPEIHATDVNEVAVIERRRDGSVEVSLAERDDADGRVRTGVYFRRAFHPGETHEIRVDLHGGGDLAIVRGDGDDIRVRVIGGGGADVLIDSSRARTYLYDGGAATRFVTGSRTRIDRRAYEAPPSPDPAHEHLLDWGHWLRPSPWLSAGPGVGLFLGGGGVLYRYGFRKVPYSHRIIFRAGYATGVARPSAEVNVHWRQVKPGVDARLLVRTSGIEVIRFHGFGNETVRVGGGSFHRVVQTEWAVMPTITLEPANDWRIDLGPVGKITETDADDPTTFIGMQTGLYGTGTLAQVGLQGGVTVDTRNLSLAPTAGMRVEAAGSVYPGALDLRETFGELHGSVATYLTAGPTLALRVGAKKLWGDFPFYEAAFLGGAATLRGFEEQRFAGDASVYGNVELRIPLGRLRFLVPTTVGVFGLTDVGRVYCDNRTICPDEASDTWHHAVGGGLWFSALAPQNTLSVSLANGDDFTGFYASAGFMF